MNNKQHVNAIIRHLYHVFPHYSVLLYNLSVVNHMTSVSIIKFHVLNSNKYLLIRYLVKLDPYQEMTLVTLQHSVCFAIS